MKPAATDELLRENAELRARLGEAEETLQAIRSGDVDALVVGRRIYSLAGAETPYRVLFEVMNEGAATLAEDGTVLFANRRMAEMLRTPPEGLLGCALRPFVKAADLPAFDRLLDQARHRAARADLLLQCRDGATVPVQLSCTATDKPGAGGLCVVATDLTERRRAEESLRRSELELKEAQRLAHIGSWWLDAATGEVRWTEELFRMQGLDPTSPPPPFAEHHRLFTPESWARLSTALPRTRETGMPYELELEMVRPDGAPAWMLARGEQVRNSRGKVTGLRGTAQDITERKRAEEEIRRLNADLECRVRERTRELAESEERLRAVLRATATGTFEVDLQTGEGRWNDVEYELLGLKPGEVPPGPQTFFRYVHPDDVGPLGAQWEEAKRKGALDAEFRVVRADGEVRWLTGKGHFAYAHQGGTDSSMPQGEPLRFLGVNFDITERKRTELALRQIREDLDRAQMVGQIGSWRLDLRRNTLTWSDENHRIFGVPRGTPLTYESFLAIIHPDDRSLVDKQWKASLEGAPYDIEHRLVVEGRVKWVREKAYLEFDPAGQLRGGFGITQDITDRKRTEFELRQLAAELQSANNELEAFSYSVSHDLRAPLRAMDGFARIALTKHQAELSPEAREALQIVRSSSQQMGALIDELLVFSRLGRQEVRKTSVNPAGLVRECLAILHPETVGRRVEIITGELPECSADPGLLKLVWMNLLSNALKYSRKSDPARIEIGCRRDGETVYFVRDNGVGFKMAYAGKLFGVFQRLHRAEDYEGTGVGLATAQRIVHRHGGRIWAEAELNRGATFFFTLEPVASPDRPSASNPPAHEPSR